MPPDRGGVRDRTRGAAAAKRLGDRSGSLRCERCEDLRRDLHDGVGQVLFALVAGLRAMEAQSKDAPHAEQVSALADLAGQAMDETRRLLQGGEPAFLEDLDLSEAVTAFAESILRPAGISLQVACANAPRDLPTRVRKTLYRVAQEALSNAAKHSGATTVLVSLSEEADMAVLQVRDNGWGMSPSSAPGTGVGLAAMRERVRQAGGRLDLRSTPGRGVQLRVALPIS